MKKKIVITDDDESIQDIFQIIFEKAGYDVQVFADASFILQNEFEIPDLFLLDRQLSGFDGLKVCQFLKGQHETKDIPVIIISATPGINVMAEHAGADGFIEKPFSVKDLLLEVEKFI